MRTNQVSLRVELFNKEEPIQFSIYADSNHLNETLNRVIHALYDELSKRMPIDDYNDFINWFRDEPCIVYDEGVCEVYGDWFAAFNKMEDNLKNDKK